MEHTNSSLRIIAGKWRSRKITFLPLKGVRPTTDAARETLFNWLMPIIPEANCLDLFAGSGALGFEALSRGAKHVVMVDAAARIIAHLKANAELLGTAALDFVSAYIPKQLNKIPPQSFDIIFLDPPFKQDLLQPTWEKLIASCYINQNTHIYIEVEPELEIEKIISPPWIIVRQKQSKHVGSYLLKQQ